MSKSFKIIIYLFVLAFFGWVVYSNYTDYILLPSLLRSADLITLGYTLAVGLGNLAIYGYIFRFSFSLISPSTELPKLFNKTLAYTFVSLSTPVGVAGANAYIIRYLSSAGISHIKGFFGVLISTLQINISFLIFLVVTGYFFHVTSTWEQYHSVATTLLVLLTFGVSIPLLLFVIMPGTSAKISAFVVALINTITRPILRKSVISKEHFEQYIIEAMSLSSRFDHSILRFIKLLPLSLIYHGLNMVTLYFSFLAFGYTIPLVSLFSLYGVIVLFTIISPTPHGIGVVEGLAHTSAISLGLPSTISLAGILIYRIAVLWLPAVVGIFAFRKD